jgi:hypothetical protein
MIYATITIEHSEIQNEDRKFLREWAKKLNVSIPELLKRIALAALRGEHYVEKMPG